MEYPMWNFIAHPRSQEGILFLEKYALVHKDHKIINFLAAKPYLINCNIREQPLFDGYYKIERTLVSVICDGLAKVNVIKIQRWIRSKWLTGLEHTRQSKREAVAMCLHSRLGQASGLGELGKDLVALVVDKLKDVEDERLKRGRLVPPAKPKLQQPRYIAAPVWTDLSKVDLKKLNGR